MTHVERPKRETALTLGLIFLGGAVGTTLRYFLSLAIPTPGGIPMGILIINIVGAFLLGAFMGYLAARGANDLREQRLRMLIGTGMMGGFTTYSSFADDSAMLLDQQRLAVTILYIAATLILGGLASWLGVLFGRSTGGHTNPGTSTATASDSPIDGGSR